MVALANSPPGDLQRVHDELAFVTTSGSTSLRDQVKWLREAMIADVERTSPLLKGRVLVAEHPYLNAKGDKVSKSASYCQKVKLLICSHFTNLFPSKFAVIMLPYVSLPERYQPCFFSFVVVWDPDRAPMHPLQ